MDVEYVFTFSQQDASFWTVRLFRPVATCGIAVESIFTKKDI